MCAWRPDAGKTRCLSDDDGRRKESAALVDLPPGSLSLSPLEATTTAAVCPQLFVSVKAGGVPDDSRDRGGRRSEVKKNFMYLYDFERPRFLRAALLRGAFCRGLGELRSRVLFLTLLAARWKCKLLGYRSRPVTRGQRHGVSILAMMFVRVVCYDLCRPEKQSFGLGTYLSMKRTFFFRLLCSSDLCVCVCVSPVRVACAKKAGINRQQKVVRVTG